MAIPSPGRRLDEISPVTMADAFDAPQPLAVGRQRHRHRSPFRLDARNGQAPKPNPPYRNTNQANSRQRRALTNAPLAASTADASQNSKHR